MTHHTDSLTERWPNLSLAEQLANAGSEVSRVCKWRGRDRGIAQRAFERLLELLDLTLGAQRDFPVLKEVARTREQVVAAWLDESPASAQEWEALNRYFLQFAWLARNPR